MFIARNVHNIKFKQDKQCTTK